MQGKSSTRLTKQRPADHYSLYVVKNDVVVVLFDLFMVTVKVVEGRAGRYD